jgi:hypothetical protein
MEVDDSAWIEILYNILTEFAIPMKLMKLIPMCIHMDRNLSGSLQTSRSIQLSVLSLMPTSTAFLLGLLFVPGDGCDIFLQNVRFCLYFMAL